MVRRSSRNAGKNVDYKEKPEKVKEFIVSSSSDESDSESQDADMQEDVNSKDITKKVEIKEKKVRKVPQKKVRAKKFRKGKWNPLIQIVHYDFLKNEPDHDVKLDDSVRMSNLNAIRAVFTNDLKLMEKVFFDTKNISTLNACWSPDIDMTALDYLAQRN